MKVKPAPAPHDFLKDCMLDGDPAVLARARRLRRRALAVSALIQAVLLALAVLYPLVATGERPRLPIICIPLPPVSGPAHTPERAHPGGTTQKPGYHKPLPIVDGIPIFQPPRVPTSIYTGPDAAPPPNDVRGEGPAGPWIPGADQLPPGNRAWTPLHVEQPRPPAEEKRKPVKLSEPVMQAQLIERIEPEYPPLARQTHSEGTVELRAIIDRDGRIRDLEVLRGHPFFIQVARDAVLRWRYRPTILNGEPVEVETIITIIFRLR